jgi:hypothetical protein
MPGLVAFGQISSAQVVLVTDPPGDDTLALRQDQDEPPPAEQAIEEQTREEVIEESVVEVVEGQPLPGPKYLNLRYDEDFSYLDGPEGSYRSDLFDPVKWIHITDDLTLTIGGEFRARLESETNKAYGSTEPAQDTFFLHRYFLHFDLRYRKLARVFVQGIHSQIEDRDLALLGIHENRWDLQQGFFDIRVLGEEVPLTIRVGRQELQYGKQRLISPLDWSNNRRKFDAAKIFYQHEKFDIDFFYARPVPISVAEGLHRKPDTLREEAHFYGVYTTLKAIPNHTIDLYFLGLNDKGRRVNANGRAGDQSIYTIGGRIGGKTGQLDYDGELAGQWGKFAGDTVHAWMGAAEAGYTFETCPGVPRLGIGFDYASGDDNPRDGTHDTFNQLFPFSHYYLGFIDATARQNILASNVNLTFKPVKKVTTRLAWYTFWNDAKRDALYNAGGAAVRRNVFGGAGHDIGNELDLTIKYAMDAHQSVLFGYSHFWGNNFIRATGPSEDADYLYLQYAFKF